MIPIIKPVLGDEEVEAVKRPLLSGWVTQGPEVKAFEEEFAALVGSTYACATSSCTTALHLALKAVGVGEGDEVITVSHSYIATSNAIRYCGATPRFIDIDPSTFNMDPELIEPAINERTRAILCVHQMGMPCDLERILGIARQHDLPVVEDAACAIGSEIRIGDRWEKIGKPHGDIAAFSFHPRKVLTTGDGGMLTTNNAEYDTKFKLWRQHAMSVPDTVRHSAKEIIFEEYNEIGYNYRMTDIQAAVGRVQLTKLEDILAKRRDIAGQYTSLLGDVKFITLPQQASFAKSNWQSYCLLLDPSRAPQKAFMQYMLDNGIATRRGIMSTHMEKAYQNTYPNIKQTGHYAKEETSYLLRSQQATEQGVIIPVHHELTGEEILYICDTIRLFFS